MTPSKRTALIKALDEVVTAILCKADGDKWLTGLSDAEKKKAVAQAAKMGAAVGTVLDAQRQAYLKALGEMRKAALPGAARIAIPATGFDDATLNTFIGLAAAQLFSDDERTVDALRETYEKQVGDFLLEVSRAEIRNIEPKSTAATQKLTDTAAKWLENKGINFAHEVTRSTHNGIVKVLQDALKDGAANAGVDMVRTFPGFFQQGALANVRARLRGIEDTALYNRLYQQLSKAQAFETYRAQRIARTETIPALNAGKLDAWRRSEVVVGKRWRNAKDSRSRPAHAAADGQVRLLEEAFDVGGEKLMHPGDSSLGASAGNIIQCRCTMQSVLRSSEDGKKLLERSLFHDGRYGALPVTEESIAKIKQHKSKLLTPDAQKRLAECERDLLRRAATVPENTELAAVLDMDGNPLRTVDGTHGGNRVKIPNPKKDHIAIHTHPSGFTFSPEDVTMFAERERTRMLVAVGHNGRVYTLEKLDNYQDGGIANGYMDAAREMPDYTSSAEKYASFMKIFAKKGAKYGYRYTEAE